MKLKSLLILSLLTAALPAFAGTDAPSDKNAKAVTETKPTESPYKIYGWIQAGATFNSERPADHINFGHLFTDRSNQLLLNQVALTFEKVLDPKATGFDWGYKVQGMYGSDSRYIHSLGLLDHTTNSIYQPDLVEAYLNYHFPVITEGGLDLKIGKFVTLEGAETIDPRTNVFYSHSYIFNYGIPFNHLGALFTLHTTKVLDLYGGVTRGVNTSINDNNDAVAFHGGFGLNFNDGALTIVAATHLGPETPHLNTGYRYLNCVTTTWKITKELTSITDLNYTYDKPSNATGYGAAQYFTYAVNDWLTPGIRAEVFRDASGFYVAQFAGANDFVNTEKGNAVNNVNTYGGGDTTYLGLTAGATIKVPVPKPFTGFFLRPEVRYDRSCNGSTPFNGGTDKSQWTFAIEARLEF